MCYVKGITDVGGLVRIASRKVLVRLDGRQFNRKEERELLPDKSGQLCGRQGQFILDCSRKQSSIPQAKVAER